MTEKESIPELVGQQTRTYDEVPGIAELLIWFEEFYKEKPKKDVSVSFVGQGIRGVVEILIHYIPDTKEVRHDS